MVSGLVYNFSPEPPECFKLALIWSSGGNLLSFKWYKSGLFVVSRWLLSEYCVWVRNKGDIELGGVNLPPLTENRGLLEDGCFSTYSLWATEPLHILSLLYNKSFFLSWLGCVRGRIARLPVFSCPSKNTISSCRLSLNLFITVCLSSITICLGEGRFPLMLLLIVCLDSLRLSSAGLMGTLSDSEDGLSICLDGRRPVSLGLSSRFSEDKGCFRGLTCIGSKYTFPL